jgi:hypothetical protein
MAWKKGESGNPLGRAREKALQAYGIKKYLGKLWGKHGQKLADVLYELITNPQTDQHVRIKAITVMAPYLWGRPMETLEIKGNVSGSVRVVHQYFPPTGGMIEAQSTEDVRRLIAGETITELTEETIDAPPERPRGDDDGSD